MMKNKTDNFEQMLKNALLEEESLSIDLINKTREKLHRKEIENMSLNNRKPLRWVASIAVGLLLTGITALATWQLLTPSEVASELDEEGLMFAFDGEDAIHINETTTSEGYIFTLLSIVSGEGLTGTAIDVDGDIQHDRTYAVVAIEREDGTPMNESASSFFISPYIQGFAPWQVNIASLGLVGGGWQETFINGILYRLIDMENVEVFADHGVYLGISLGNFSFEAFDFDAESGMLSLNPDFDGPRVLFELPLDSSLADEERVQELLNSITFPEDVNEDEGMDDESDYLDFMSECSGFMFCSIDEDGNVITENDMTFLELTYDELADFLEARIERDIENGEPEGVISGARRDREDWLRLMREYNIEFVEVWYDDDTGAMSISWTNPDYTE